MTDSAANAAADTAADLGHPLPAALREALITETILGDDEDPSAAWQPGDGRPEETGLTALPRIQPDWYKTAWYVGDDLLAHVADGAWISVRARSPEALLAYTLTPRN